MRAICKSGSMSGMWKRSYGYWFGCPWCGRRCAIIYGVSGDGYFGCRRCLRLGYSSEAESPMDRLWRQQRKLEDRLGDNYRRPKWMRMRTYERIWAKIDEIEERKDEVCWSGIGRIMRRGGLTMADLWRVGLANS
jgi:hypothetical protein